MNGTDLAPLRARIAALIEFGPIKASVARRILVGEGWTVWQIQKAKARVAVSVRSYGLWRKPFTRDETGQFTKKPAPAPLAFPARKVARVGKCSRHLFTTTKQVDGQWLCALCEQQGEGVA